ncbi:uncharacterized protein LOC129282971 [Lytechinus pictus]|uniref:uncharacterized protein LOC129282971 n=1 Tax=Lytechinus pictus TaxID=7653 RepID=UPI0030B9BD72
MIMDCTVEESMIKLRGVVKDAGEGCEMTPPIECRLTQTGGEVETLLSTVLKTQRESLHDEDAESDAVVKQQTAVDEVLYHAMVHLDTELSKKDKDSQEETEIEVNLLARLEQVLEYCSHRLDNKIISLEVLLLLSVVLDPHASFNKADTWSSRSSFSKSSVLAQLINHFGACGGFELVRQRLRQARDLSIAHLAALLRPFGQCYQQLTADTIKSYFLPTVDSVCSHLLSCSDRQLFQQDIQVGDLQATYLVGPRAAYVIVEAVMNLLSAVKSEEAEAEVKVQYWQDTILTRLKHALEDEASSGECTPSAGTASPQGQVASRRTSRESQKDITTPGSINDSECEMKSPTSLSSRSCQTLPYMVDSVQQDTLDLIERLAKESGTPPFKDPLTSSSPCSPADTCSDSGTIADPTDCASASQQMITIDIEPPSPRPPHASTATMDATIDLDMPSTSYGIVEHPSKFPFDRMKPELVSSDVIVWNQGRPCPTLPCGSRIPLESKHLPLGIGLDSSDTSSMVSMTSVARSASELGTTCRVCFEGETSSKNRLIRPCRCTGSAASIHRQCLVKWIQISGNRTCEVCGARFSYVPLSEHMRGVMDKFRSNRRWRNVAFAVLVGLVVILYLIIFAVFPGGIMNN